MFHIRTNFAPCAMPISMAGGVGTVAHVGLDGFRSPSPRYRTAPRRLFSGIATQH